MAKKAFTGAEAVLRKFNKQLLDFWFDDDRSGVRRCLIVALVGVIVDTRIIKLVRHQTTLAAMQTQRRLLSPVSVYCIQTAHWHYHLSDF